MEQHEQNQSSGTPTESQLLQISTSLKNQVEQLQTQVAQLRQQSLKMQEQLNSIPAAKTGKLSEQMEEPGAEDQIDTFNTIVLQALQAAQQSVDQALLAAAQIIADAQNLLKNPG